MVKARALTPPEENAARDAYTLLQKNKLVCVPSGRGRRPGLQPLHAALAIRQGKYVQYGDVQLDADSQLTAAAADYSLQRPKIKEYLDLLVQCDPPKSGAPLL